MTFLGKWKNVFIFLSILSPILLLILGLYFTLETNSSIKDDALNSINGDQDKMAKLYYEQSNDPYIKESKKVKNEFISFYTINTLKFPNGVQFQEAVSKTLMSGMTKSITQGVESKVPNEIIVPKTIFGKIVDNSKPKLEFKNKNKIKNEFKVNKGEIISLEAYLDEKLVSVKDEAFISVSYNPNIIKLIEYNTFMAINEGETKIGVWYFDGEANHMEKIEVLVSL